MRNLILFGLLAFALFGCRRRDVYPDYENLIGTYKCVVIKYADISSSPTVYANITPDANYEIEFQKNCKMKMIRDGECQFTRKINKCVYQFSATTENYNIELEDKNIGLWFVNDTIVMGPDVFPASLYEDRNPNTLYEAWFLKE